GALVEVAAQDAVDVVRADGGARVELLARCDHAGGSTALALASVIVRAVLGAVRVVLGALVGGGVLTGVRTLLGALVGGFVGCSRVVGGLLVGALLTGLLVVARLLRVAAGSDEHQQRHPARSGRRAQAGHHLGLHICLPRLPARTDTVRRAGSRPVVRPGA